MKRKNVKTIAVTMGDPAGVGPEVALRAINDLQDDLIIPVLIGNSGLLNAYYKGLFSNYTIINDIRAVSSGKHFKYLLDIPSCSKETTVGVGTLDSARDSLTYIDKAIELWQNGHIDAVVTGPVHKGNIVHSGTPFIGHTEYIAQAIGSDTPFMLMYSTEFRVILATTHHALNTVPSIINVENLTEVISMAYESCRLIDGGDVLLGICGLDPHCGDHGAIGDFDERITRPAVQQARSSGIPIEGPFAADTLFLPQNWKKYNMVIAQYHDQGLIPFKILAFENGVNITLGLPIVRTSVDHGTAFDIAGKGIAQYTSMLEAIKVADRLSGKDNSR